MKTILALAVFGIGITSSSAAGVADYAATYKGTGNILYLGKVYPSAITLSVTADGKAAMTQTFTWSLGPVTNTFSGFISASWDIVLQSPSGDKAVGGEIHGKTTGAVVTAVCMALKADPRTFRLTRQ
jgi:hypothetical protein